MTDESSATESAIVASSAAQAAAVASVETAVAVENAEAAAGAASVAEDAAAGAVAAAAQAESVAEDAATREAAAIIANSRTELETCRAEIDALKETLTRMEAKEQSTSALLTKLSWLTEPEAEIASPPSPQATDGATKDSDGGADPKDSASVDPESHAPATEPSGESRDDRAATAPEAPGRRKHRWL
jgi:hypothetical protein